jgi:hypothetical protein
MACCRVMRPLFDSFDSHTRKHKDGMLLEFGNESLVRLPVVSSTPATLAPWGTALPAVCALWNASEHHRHWCWICNAAFESHTAADMPCSSMSVARS